GATLVATLIANLEFAIYVGSLLSLGLYLNRTVKPPLVRAMPAPLPGSYHFIRDVQHSECPQLSIRYLDGSLFFAAIAHIRREFGRIRRERPAAGHLLVLCSGVNHCDVAGAELIADEARRRRAMGGDVYLHYVKGPVLRMLDSTGSLAVIGKSNVFDIGAMTIESVVERLNPRLCAECSIRSFHCCPPLDDSKDQEEDAQATATTQEQTQDPEKNSP
ncbi:MAG: sodium-independent anion transporter, partial [Quisquiliibacterium sp.]